MEDVLTKLGAQLREQFPVVLEYGVRYVEELLWPDMRTRPGFVVEVTIPGSSMSGYGVTITAALDHLFAQPKHAKHVR